MSHYNQTPRRKAEFIKLPNTLKAKVGEGGLSDDILDKAQKLLEENTVDFQPLGEMYLARLDQGIEKAKKADAGEDLEYLISVMLYPSMQLKANGGMFHYPIITEIADRLIQYLEVLERLDRDSLELIGAFHTTMRAVLQGQIKGSGGEHARELIAALDQACHRYFEKYPEVKPVKV